ATGLLSGFLCPASRRSPKPAYHASRAILQQRLSDMSRDFVELSSHRRSAVFAHDGDPAIAGLARGDVDWNLTEQRNSQPPRFAFAAASSKDIVALAVRRRHEVTHILDQTKDGHVDLVDHGSSLARVDQSNWLWRSDDDRSRKGDRLHDGKLNIAGAGREIEHQIIELAPFDLPQKLLGVTGHHRST